MASWKDIARGAKTIAGDDKDEAESGLAIETTDAKMDVASSLPSDGANSKTPVGPDAKGGKVLGAQMGKAQAKLLKALENPEVVKALDTLEKAGVIPDEEEEEDEEEEKMYKAVEKRFSAIEKQLTNLASSITKMVAAQAGGSELQKAGLVAVGETTPKPAMAALERQPAYSKGQSEIVKAVVDAEAKDAIPDFATLATKKLQGVYQ